MQINRKIFTRTFLAAFLANIVWVGIGGILLTYVNPIVTVIFFFIVPGIIYGIVAGWEPKNKEKEK